LVFLRTRLPRILPLPFIVFCLRLNITNLTLSHPLKQLTAVEELVKLLALIGGITDYVVLFSTKNLKNSVEEKRQC